MGRFINMRKLSFFSWSTFPKYSTSHFCFLPAWKATAWKVFSFLKWECSLGVMVSFRLTNGRKLGRFEVSELQFVNFKHLAKILKISDHEVPIKVLLSQSKSWSRIDFVKFSVLRLRLLQKVFQKPMCKHFEGKNCCPDVVNSIDCYNTQLTGQRVKRTQVPCRRWVLRWFRKTQNWRCFSDFDYDIVRSNSALWRLSYAFTFATLRHAFRRQICALVIAQPSLI